MSLHVAVCIVAFRNSGDVTRCLEGLALSTWRDFEVVVVENGGLAAFEAMTGQIPPRLPTGQAVKVVLAGGNLGYAGGVNLCIAESSEADAWWVLNPDTYPSPGALARMVERLQRADCDAVGNTVVLMDGRVQSHGGLWRKAFARAVSMGYGAQADVAPNPETIEASQNYLNGASMLIGRRFIEVAGTMDERYFLYCEEVEWCLRAKSRGLRLGYAADAAVMHEQGATTGHSPDLKCRSKLSVFLGERNRLILTRDLYPMLLPVAAGAALLLLVVRFGRSGAWRQLGYAFEGWCAGILNRRGAPGWQ